VLISFGAFGIVGFFYRILEVHPCEKLNHFLACCGYLNEGLKGEISNTGNLGFDLIA